MEENRRTETPIIQTFLRLFAELVDKYSILGENIMIL